MHPQLCWCPSPAVLTPSQGSRAHPTAPAAALYRLLFRGVPDPAAVLPQAQRGGGWSRASPRDWRGRGGKGSISPPCRPTDSSATECHHRSWKSEGSALALTPAACQPCDPAHPPNLCSARHPFSLPPPTLSFQMTLSCLEVTQRMATTMPGRFLTLGRILSLGRGTGMCPGFQRREMGPGMLPQVRGQCSTAASLVPSPGPDRSMLYREPDLPTWRTCCGRFPGGWKMG